MENFTTTIALIGIVIVVASLLSGALEQIRSKVGVRRDYESLYALGLAFSGFALAESVGACWWLAGVERCWITFGGALTC